ncbi:MAG: HAD-IIIC family phosphatase, partial [Planctomycetaceae bacterium]|nr:HAD-IIIC family phosphatase [Planctomycetaceae bacterium]
MASVPAPLVQGVLPRLFQGACGEAVDLLQRHIVEHGPTPDSLALLRLAAQRTGQNALYYLKLWNLWNGQGQPALKPNVAVRKLRLLTDYTSDNLAPLIKLFAATFGVHLDVQVSAFDSVEQLALDANSSLELDAQTLVVLSLSEHWLERYLGKAALVTDEALARTQTMLDNIVAGLRARRPAQILVTNFTPRAYARPTGLARVGGACGWNHAVARLNVALVERAEPGVNVIDLAEALFAAGGRAVAGRLSYFRSKMAFESAGTIAAAREIAVSLAQLLGKTHRAVVTDWDNTLWGGEVAEAGSHGVVCGVDSPDALAYLQVQEFMRSLTSTGTLLAAVSRNDPRVVAILDENRDLALRAADFASLQISFQPKSQSIAQVSRELGFGSEFMVFVDDSLFELAEAVTMHPYLDVLLAGPEPEATLRALSESRFFHAVSLEQADLERGAAAQALKQQRDFQAS